MSDSLTIVIGGDTAPTRSNEPYLASAEQGAVFHNVQEVLSSADLAVVNLECPLTDASTPIVKAGPCLKAAPSAVEGLIAAGIDVFALANNHIMDFGAAGLSDTLDQLASRHALSVGAGRNIQEARQALFVERNGYKIALVAVAEHEFSIAGEDCPGAAPFDPFDTMEDIERARAASDLLIVLYHGGIEHYRLPSPNLQKICRTMVAHGATIVICQHSHCIGSYEVFQEGHIVYGQGNLLFDASDRELWKTGLLVKIRVTGQGPEIEFLPVVKQAHGVELAKAPERDAILCSFRERSTRLSDSRYLEAEWQRFAQERQYRYLQAFLCLSELLVRVDNRLGHAITKLLVGPDARTVLYNFVSCESHLDVLRALLKYNDLSRIG